MKTHYYYLRDEYNLPRITVCLVEFEDKVVTRGVALCSFLDSPTKKLGNMIAKGRAVKAYKEKRSCRPINRTEAYNVAGAVDWPFDQIIARNSKCTFEPKLTDFEINLIRED
jgi:hypothetical protein